MVQMPWWIQRSSIWDCQTAMLLVAGNLSGENFMDTRGNEVRWPGFEFQLYYLIVGKLSNLIPHLENGNY